MRHSNPESIFHVDRADVFFNALERVSLCFGMAAVLVAFAARLPAFGDIVLWGVLFYLVEFVLPGLGKDNPLRLTFYLRELLASPCGCGSPSTSSTAARCPMPRTSANSSRSLPRWGRGPV